MPTILSMPSTLSDSDRTLLDFEARAPRSLGAKEEAIRQELGLTPTRYYQRLNLLLESPEALAYAPQLVRRLRALRERG
ncbi:DUF3263 domain-containing protein [Corynebacterium imitans]|nr:DUF3263 domain-containing protein [Corynebacterium imitans]MDK8307329.1 DUF3263 domain-containing protein [Corynebacterium imitans]MDK8638496.1 DUF3263 domain-containing protein [Corynebacterium imitans]MDK8773714.1 DUF3263 domain-containing protein [Corynebacterium imitans]